MPNMKIYVDRAVWADELEPLVSSMPFVRETLCELLGVDQSACQLAMLPVWGVSGQAPINAELQILPKPDRTRDVVLSVCEELRQILGDGGKRRVAVRVTSLDPDTYVAVK